MHEVRIFVYHRDSIAIMVQIAATISSLGGFPNHLVPSKTA